MYYLLSVASQEGCNMMYMLVTRLGMFMYIMHMQACSFVYIVYAWARG